MKRTVVVFAAACSGSAETGRDAALDGPGGSSGQQLNVFNGPLNPSATDYAHLISVLSNLGNRAYITGVTTTLPLGCVGDCSGATGTFLDHVAAGLGGGSCPAVAFDSIDGLLTTVAGYGYANNLVLAGAGFVNNTTTPEYLASEAWADNLDTDCTTQDASLTWIPNHPYLPSDYILANGRYWQLQISCTPASGHDIRCTSGPTVPGCLANAVSPCSDGAAMWTLLPDSGVHAPPLDFWCDANTTGKMQFDCYKLSFAGTASITNHTATVTVTNPPTYPMGQPVTVSGSSNGVYDCPSGCKITGSSPTTVTYDGLATATSPVENLSAGTIFGAHSLNITTPNAPAAIAHQLPIPWEQPMRVWRKYMFDQIREHYTTAGNPTLGYVRLGLTKAGESDTSGIDGWPYGSQNQMLSYENEMYEFMGQHGCGSSFACVGNIHSYPSPEAAMINANNIGFDNNALGVDQVTQIVAGNCQTAGALPNSGDWCLNFDHYPTLPNGKPPITTLQTGGITQFSSPGACTPNQVGAMSVDAACVSPPFTSGYPGNLPIAYQYLATNVEVYFCDVLLALDSDYQHASCMPRYQQASYESLYQAAFHAFLEPR